MCEGRLIFFARGPSSVPNLENAGVGHGWTIPRLDTIYVFYYNVLGIILPI